MSKVVCDPWRRRLASSLAFIALMGPVKAVQAQTLSAPDADEAPLEAGWLEVTRNAGAETCPTETHLRRQIESLLDATQPSTPILVRFAREPGTFVAEISRDKQPGIRRLSDNHHDCRPLASAVVTAIALLVDAEAPSPPLPLPEAPVPTAEKPPAAAPGVPSAPPPRSPPQRFVGALGYFGPAVGLVAGSHPLLGGEGFLQIQRWRVGLGAAVRFSGVTGFEPGEIRHALAVATLRLCARVLGREILGLSACSGLFGGRIDLKASGFTNDGTASRPFFAIPFEAHLSGRIVRLRGFAPGFRIGITGLVPTIREIVVVEGLGPAVTTPRVAGVLWAGFEGALGW